MSEFKTPVRRLRCSVLKIPASPQMKKIGFGTGVAVYELSRSPLANITRSPWAMKRLLSKTKNNKELDKRLEAEAEILRRLSHENIVGFRAFLKGKDGRNMLLMEECASCLGNMIEDRFEEINKPFEVDKINKVLLDMASALDYLHKTALILHCDIKSYNILIKGDFEICKLCDFGVCISLKKDGTSKAREYTGTPIWSAPEVLKHPPIVTQYADIYSLGLVIWEMIALQPPIDDELSQSFDENCSLSSSDVRKRPSLPEEVELGNEYNTVLELFYCCTLEEYKERPTASILLDILS